MQRFHLVPVCLFGLAAATAQAAEQPNPPQPPLQPTADGLQKGVFIQLASLTSSNAAVWHPALRAAPPGSLSPGRGIG